MNTTENTMATKFDIIKDIKKKLESFNEEIYLDAISCREGKLISINPTDENVKYVNVWKMKTIHLYDISPYALNMLNIKLDDVIFKKKHGFDKETNNN